VSLSPWISRTGDLTCWIAYLFKKRSLTKRDGSFPKRDLTASLRDVKGESRIKHAIFGLSEAKWVAGPEPIDLPMRRISHGE
jgi:hypothetical protein